MPDSHIPIRTKSSPRTAALKEAIIASFALDPDPARLDLAGFGESDWLSILWWLDVSGMAIHFYNRACDAQLNESRSQLWARYYVEIFFILRRLAVQASHWNSAVARIGR